MGRLSGNSSRDSPGRAAGSAKGPIRGAGGGGSGRHGQNHSVKCDVCRKRVFFDTRNGRTVEVLENGRGHVCPGNQIRMQEQMRRIPTPNP